MIAVAVRPDLSARTDLSKSALATFDLCSWKAWHAIHHRLPVIPNERMTFGSAVDAGVEAVIVQQRAYGAVTDMGIAYSAAAQVILRDDTGVNFGEVETAILAFVDDVIPKHDWALCSTQHAIAIEMPGWGPVSGHPDIILHDGTVLDVKTAAKQKNADAVATSVELGFYALAREVETGTRPERVGYLVWVRLKKPYWQQLVVPVTPQMLAHARVTADGYTRARKADAALNAKAETPINWAFNGGPKFAGLCGDCEYAPGNGGPCEMAVEGTDGEV